MGYTVETGENMLPPAERAKARELIKKLVDILEGHQLDTGLTVVGNLMANLIAQNASSHDAICGMVEAIFAAVHDTAHAHFDRRRQNPSLSFTTRRRRGARLTCQR